MGARGHPPPGRRILSLESHHPPTPGQQMRIVRGLGESPSPTSHISNVSVGSTRTLTPWEIYFAPPRGQQKLYRPQGLPKPSPPTPRCCVARMRPALPTGRIVFSVTTIYIDLNVVYIVRSANMVCGTNQCGWLMRGRNVFSGKNCVGPFCAQHNYQVKKEMNSRIREFIPFGVQADYRLCRACCGNALRPRLMPKEQKAKRDYNLVTADLAASQIPI